jgi:hypothetical protein
MIDWKKIGLLAFALFASAAAQAQLRIDITSGVTDPVPIGRTDAATVRLTPSTVRSANDIRVVEEPGPYSTVNR